MTDTTASLVHRCQVCRDADEPTALEFAFELLGVGNSPERQHLLVVDLGSQADSPFSLGWYAGVEATLEESTLPIETGEGDDTLAWLVGFVAGQYSLIKGTPSPSCNVKAHEVY